MTDVREILLNSLGQTAKGISLSHLALLVDNLLMDIASAGLEINQGWQGIEGEREELVTALKKARKLYFIGQAQGQAETVGDEEEEARLEEKGHALLVDVDTALARMRKDAG